MTSRASHVALQTTVTEATQFGLPLPGGRSSCTTGDPVADNRATNGPGRGDLFVVAVRPPFLYWETAGLSNFRYPRKPIPGLAPARARAFARQIASGRDLPAGLDDLTAAKRRALLDLDPFFKPVVLPGLAIEDPRDLLVVPFPGRFAPATRLDPGRFLFVPPCQSNATGTGFQQSRSQGLRIADADTLKELQRQQDTGGGPTDTAVELTLKALAADAAIVVGSPGSFSAIDSAFDELIYGENLTITTSTTVSSSKLLERAAENEITQSFFVQDTNRPMSVEIYYDRFFGTFAFKEVFQCNGHIREVAPVRPAFAWTTSVAVGQSAVVTMPVPLQGNLSAAGAAIGRSANTFRAVPASEYVPTVGSMPGLPPGLQLDPTTGRLTGATSVGAGTRHNALFAVSNEFEEQVGHLWVTVEVRPPPPPGTICELVNIASSGTSQLSCCTGFGACQSFWLPSAGDVSVLSP